MFQLIEFSKLQNDLCGLASTIALISGKSLLLQTEALRWSQMQLMVLPNCAPRS